MCVGERECGRERENACVSVYWRFGANFPKSGCSDVLTLALFSSRRNLGSVHDDDPLGCNLLER